MSARRGVGLGAFQNRSLVSTSYATHGASLRSRHLASVQTQLSVFQSQLHAFALQHGDAIRSNPTFRAEFTRMCNAIGVDPLAASNAKLKAGEKGGGAGWWAQLRRREEDGDVSDLHLRLAMRIVEICRASRNENGGLIGVEECKEKVRRGQGIGGEVDITDKDIWRAVESLKPLGSGFSIIKVGMKQMIRSIPKELSTDQSTVLEALQILGYTTSSMLVDNLKWEHARAETVLEDLLADSLVWIDLQSEEKEYWAPPTEFSEG